jgi:hypothetical protein
MSIKWGKTPYKNQRKFICLSCQEATYFSISERKSVRRCQCRWCGSYALEPANYSKVKEEIKQESTNLSAKSLRETSSIIVRKK